MLDLLTGNSRASCCGKTFRVYYPQRTTHSDTFWLDWLKSVSRYNQRGGKWTNAGYVHSARTIAWRILDAQYFGLAQRRKRVFVVASARQRSVAQILIERKSLCGDIETSETARESITTYTEGSFGTYRQSALGGGSNC